MSVWSMSISDERGALERRRPTSVAKDTRGDAARESLVESLATRHVAKLLLLLGGEVSAAPSGAIRVQFQTEHSKVGRAQGDGCVPLRLARLEGRVDSRGDDTSPGDDLAREVAVGREEDVTGQFTDGHHVGRFL